MTIDKEKLKALAERLVVEHVGGEFDPAPSTPMTATDVLALLAEIERLEMDNRSLKGSCSKLGAEHAGMARTLRKANRMQLEARQECDQIKVENEKMRSFLAEVSRTSGDKWAVMAARNLLKEFGHD